MKKPKKDEYIEKNSKLIQLKKDLDFYKERIKILRIKIKKCIEEAKDIKNNLDMSLTLIFD